MPRCAGNPKNPPGWLAMTAAPTVGKRRGRVPDAEMKRVTKADEVTTRARARALLGVTALTNASLTSWLYGL